MRRKILYHLKNNKGELSEDYLKKQKELVTDIKGELLKYNYREREYYESLSDEERKKLIDLKNYRFRTKK